MACKMKWLGYRTTYNDKQWQDSTDGWVRAMEKSRIKKEKKKKKDRAGLNWQLEQERIENE
tara:strand:- start:907 stop:1089 length:183 start_codon:yes stop_codon:yes gene_type:complete